MVHEIVNTNSLLDTHSLVFVVTSGLTRLVCVLDRHFFLPTTRFFNSSQYRTGPKTLRVFWYSVLVTITRAVVQIQIIDRSWLIANR